MDMMSANLIGARGNRNGKWKETHKVLYPDFRPHLNIPDGIYYAVGVYTFHHGFGMSLQHYEVHKYADIVWC